MLRISVHWEGEEPVNKRSKCGAVLIEYTQETKIRKNQAGDLNTHTHTHTRTKKLHPK